MILYKNIYITANILAVVTLAAMGSGCTGNGDDVADSKTSLVELPSKIQRSAVIKENGEKLKACVRVTEKDSGGEAKCQAMEFIGTKVKLTIPNLKANTSYIVSIEFSFDSEVYGKVVLATVEKSTTTVTGSNQLSFESNIYQYPDDDNDGWDNNGELERGTNPYIVDKITRTSQIDIGNAECLYGGTRVETGVDENANETLDDNEVDIREYICKDAPKNVVLVEKSTEPAGINCPNGGLRIEQGIDANNNSKLDQAEITETKFVCNENMGWQEATSISIENNNAGNAWEAQVALDDRGNAVAVWEEYDGTRHNIWARRLVPLIGWGAAVLIENNNVGNAFSPQVVMDDDGNALVVWQQNDGIRENIWANRFIPGIGWEVATLVETNNSGDAVAPQIAMDGMGNVVTVWQQHNGAGGEDIWSNRFVANEGWGTAELIETDAVRDSWNPQVAINSSGNAVAVWVQWWDGALRIWANRSVPGAGWGAAELIDTNNVGRSDYPQVVVDNSGNAIVVWHKNDGLHENVWGNRFSLGVGWDTATLIESNDAGDAVSPQVAMDGDGNALIVWQQSDGVRSNIWANRFDKESGLGMPELIETDNAGGARHPQIAVDSKGNAIAVWLQEDDVRSNVWANRFDKESGWSTAELIETDNVGNAEWKPQIAVDSKGNAVAVWSQLGAGSKFFDIWANRFYAQ